MIKKLILPALALTILLLLIAFRTEPKKSQHFSIEEICSDLPYHHQWEARMLSSQEEQEVKTALSQPYQYLGSGGQCYAFVSQDDQYVIKFFKQKPFVISHWIQTFPIPILLDGLKEKKTQKKLEHRNQVFMAFKLSLDQLYEETGLLYVHLNQTTHLNKTLSFCDERGAFHLLNLDKLGFVIQRKAELAFARIDSLMQKKDTDGAKEAIDKLLRLNLTLYQKGFRNRDPNFRSNYGFIGSQAIVVDVGRITFSDQIKDPKAFKVELLRAIPRFQKYLATKYPELLNYFDDCIANILKSDNSVSHESAI